MNLFVQLLESLRHKDAGMFMVMAYVILFIIVVLVIIKKDYGGDGDGRRGRV